MKLQDLEADARSGDLSGHLQTSAAEAEIVLLQPSLTLVSNAHNVDNQSFGNASEQGVKVLASDQHVKVKCSVKENENASAIHALKEPLLSENPQRNAFESIRKATLSEAQEKRSEPPLANPAGPSSSAASLTSSPSPLVMRTSSSPPLSNSHSPVLDTSSTSTASPFEGLQSQSRDSITFTPLDSPQFLKPALEQSGGDGKVSLVSKPPFKASSSSPSTITSNLSRSEKIVTSDSSPHVQCMMQPIVHLSPSAALNPLVTDVDDVAELSNLVSGLPVPSKRLRKGQQASPPVLEANGFVAQSARKRKGQSVDISQSGHILPFRDGKELNRTSSMRDQWLVKTVLPKVPENGSSRTEPDDTLSGKSRESIPEDDRDGSPSNLLVEDVFLQTFQLNFLRCFCFQI